MTRVRVEENETRFRDRIEHWYWPMRGGLVDYPFERLLVFSFIGEDVDDVRAYAFFEDVGHSALYLHFASYPGSDWFGHEAWNNLVTFLTMLGTEHIYAEPIGPNTEALLRILRRMNFTQTSKGVMYANLKRIKHNGIFVQSPKTAAVRSAAAG